jgi:hypothetical protein
MGVTDYADTKWAGIFKSKGTIRKRTNEET